MSIYLSDLINIGTSIHLAGGGISWKVISVSTLAANGNGYIANTSGGEFTLTLPATPSIGDQIGVSDYNKNFETYKCTVLRNGKKIMGLEEDFDCDVNNTNIIFVYINSVQGWKILNVV